MIPPRRIRLLLVDDHFFVRTGLSASLNSEPDLHVAAEARDCEDAVEIFRLARPDVTVMDLSLGERASGIAATLSIKAEFPQARIVIFSASDLEEDVFMAIEAGASSYLPKSVDRTELIQAIRAVHQGGMYLPEPIAQRLEARRNRPNLSPREQSVLQRIATGLTNKEIASELGLSELTVRQYVSGVLEKLGVLDRTQATTAAVRRGLVKLE